MAMSSLSRSLHEFLRGGRVVESLDDLYARDPSLRDQFADYLLYSRTTVLELKELQDDRLSGVQAIVDRYAADPGWHRPPGPLFLGDMVGCHPRGADLERDVLGCIEGPLVDQVEKANRQIRHTKATLHLGDASGLVFVDNSHNDGLGVEIVVPAVSRILTKRWPNGGLRYESIDAVVVFGQTQDVLLDDGTPAMGVDGYFHMTDRAWRAARVGNEIVTRFTTACGIPVHRITDPGAAAEIISGTRSAYRGSPQIIRIPQGPGQAGGAATR